MSAKLKLDRTEVVGLLVDLGFKSAGEWDDARILRKLAQLPQKIEDVDVAEQYRHIYHSLVQAGEGVEIELVAKKPAASPSPKQAKPAPPPKPAPQPSSGPESAVTPKRGGWKRGAVSSVVDALVTSEWQTDVEIAEKAKLPLQKVRDRLYFLVYVGRAERRRLIQVRKLVKGVR